MGILEGKKALVFGIASNLSIAYGIAKQLKAEGAVVALSYAAVHEKRIKSIAEELGSTFVEECDLSNDDEIDNLVNKYEEKFGKIDIIVHSVAFASREALSGRFMEVTRDDFRVAMDISVYTLIAVVKKFERIMSDDASVVTLSYYGSEKVVPNYNVMGVAKAALEAAVRYLAVDVGKNGKRINAVSAGPIKTLSAAGISGFKSLLSSNEQRIPLGRNVDIEDCGNLAAFLLSPKAKNITGSVIYVDGGFNITAM